MSRRPEEMVGRILANTYAVERLLGRGGMGAVYAARHVRTNGTFAVKVLNPEAAADEEIYRRFQNEARIISALRHPNIVQVTDFDQDDDGTPFLVMELLVGQDLYDRLRQVERLPLWQTLTIARQVGGALNAAHALGIIHRDVKPQNIFLARHQLTDEVEEIAKVVDFGVSKIRHEGTMATRTMGVFGTPHYMAPETTRAQRDLLDGRVDQWALAVILYRALCGKLPFDNPDPLGVLYQVVNEEPIPLQERCPELPPGVTAAIMRGLRKDPDERFVTMAEFVRALDRGAAGSPQAREAGREGAGHLLAMPTAVPAPGGAPLEMVAEPEDARAAQSSSGPGYASMHVLDPDEVSSASGRSAGAPSRIGVMVLFLGAALASAAAVFVWQRATLERSRGAAVRSPVLAPRVPAPQGIVPPVQAPARPAPVPPVAAKPVSASPAPLVVEPLPGAAAPAPASAVVPAATPTVAPTLLPTPPLPVPRHRHGENRTGLPGPPLSPEALAKEQPGPPLQLPRKHESGAAPAEPGTEERVETKEGAPDPEPPGNSSSTSGNDSKKPARKFDNNF